MMQAFELPPVPLFADDDGVIRVVGSRVTLDSITNVFDRSHAGDARTDPRINIHHAPDARHRAADAVKA